MKRIMTAFLLFSLAGCSGTGESILDLVQLPDPDLTAGADAVDVAAVPDNGPTKDIKPTTPDVAPEDTGWELPFVECEPGSGCFLDPCTTNNDCKSGFCVEHMGEAVCTTTCTEECPPGWGCKLVAESDPDVLYICVSGYSNLCKPCSISSDCKSFGGANDTCVNYGAEGSFCGGPCEYDSDCPWGFACKEAVSVDGVAMDQCVAEAGVCPCTAYSTERSLFTPCQVTNEAGTCTGKRVCTDEGLTDCDAGTPAPEECNGLDDDCDGEVDEPSLVDGKYVEHCDDGNDCTADSCAGEAGCAYENQSEGECVDNDACTIGDHCEAGQCVGLPIACDDGNECTDGLCDGVGGCQAVFNHVDCDDGNPCTVADSCNQGDCTGFPVQCDCVTDDDCKNLDDDDACNGTLHCDTSQVPYVCAVDEPTVVVCPAPQDGTSICVNVGCDPATGECSSLPDNDGYACDDGDPCSIGDKCQGGECLAGVPATCDDANVCTTDVCIPGDGCLHMDNTSVCNDGDVCTANDVCAEGLCVPGTPLDCADSNLCTDDFCDPAVGCVHSSAEGGCDDGNACTADDYCANGICLPGVGVKCDDDNPCTHDSCSIVTGCSYMVHAGVCDDGDPCTLGDSCVNGLCVPGLQLNCEDNNPCTADACTGAGQCEHISLAGACDDGNACTEGEQCLGGACIGGLALQCDDANVCTTDSCDPAGGCVHSLNTAPCSDGDPCTFNDSCAAGICFPGPELDCNDGNPCTSDTCTQAGTCAHPSIEGNCTDGNACTFDEYCQNGQCTGGQPQVCDDGNICTTDSCDPVAGCKHVLNTAPCDDGDVCTLNDHCHLGTCISAGELSCQDSNPCTDDTCHAVTGCVFSPNAQPCNDGNGCTENDKCSGGTCTGGDTPDCDDGNQCTDDVCVAAVDCVHFDNNDPCNDQNACTANEVCFAGACGGGGPILCEDNDPCTDNECDPGSGCVYPINSGPCNDGNACTAGDKCSDGECLSGGPIDCDDSDPCTVDQCEPEGGCFHDPAEEETGCGDGMWCIGGECVTILDCPAAEGHSKIFTSSGPWQIPGDVENIRIMVVGGGGGGAKGHGNGAGSGHVRKAQFEVTPCELLQVSIGVGGTYDHAGNTTSFGALKSANGGSPGLQSTSGSGAGGSGGGGAGAAGCGGNGGTGGSAGQAGCTYSGGAGGNFDDVVTGYFKYTSMSHAEGGNKGTSSHAGGGGGGGVYIDGVGTGGGDGAQSWSGKGGKGYGGGGGGGGYHTGNYANGGNGGNGVVYVEWD